jgi:hypothetical protein
MPMMDGVRLWYRSKEAPSSATEVVGRVIMLCERTRMSVTLERG